MVDRPENCLRRRGYKPFFAKKWFLGCNFLSNRTVSLTTIRWRILKDDMNRQAEQAEAQVSLTTIRWRILKVGYGWFKSLFKSVSLTTIRWRILKACLPARSNPAKI